MNRKEVLDALRSQEDPAPLFAEADAVRRRFMGDGVHLRGLIEFSNHCRRNCLYCGIRAANAKLHRYRLSSEEILACAAEAARLGYGSVVMQSGEDAHFTP
ncbi:MAG: [FeFe] hydrogenase H-cluster radical SAM maturase HydE, partial [Elusimicrobia bacterium]|nr:[FeFe] hydrogenase H-cluster radical SAM maturase HydE [Elusimicrobiota bacterium]